MALAFSSVVALICAIDAFWRASLFFEVESDRGLKLTTKQFELFPMDDYTDYCYTPPAEWEVTNRSTRTKDPKRRKTIAPVKENDRLSTAQTHTH
jgi:hypothetical protein